METEGRVGQREVKGRLKERRGRGGGRVVLPERLERCEMNLCYAVRSANTRYGGGRGGNPLLPLTRSPLLLSPPPFHPPVGKPHRPALHETMRNGAALSCQGTGGKGRLQLTKMTASGTSLALVRRRAAPFISVKHRRHDEEIRCDQGGLLSGRQTGAPSTHERGNDIIGS